MKSLARISRAKCQEILDNVHFFDNFTAEEKAVFTECERRFSRYQHGETIITQGANDHRLFVLLTGYATVYRHDAVRPLAKLWPGDIFGEVSFLTERKRTTSVVAVEDLVVFEIDQPTLLSLDIVMREKLKDNIINKLVVRLDHMNEVVAELSARVD